VPDVVIAENATAVSETVTQRQSHRIIIERGHAERDRRSKLLQARSARLCFCWLRSWSAAAAARRPTPGTLFSILGYVVLLTNSLGGLPLSVQQFSRLKDIRRRLRGERPA
jgi:hypothetical protein